MSKFDECIEKADKIAGQLLKDIEEHRNEFIRKLPEPINDTQKRIQQLTIDNGWLITQRSTLPVRQLDYEKYCRRAIERRRKNQRSYHGTPSTET